MSLDLSCADADSVDALNHLLGPAQISTLRHTERPFTWSWKSRDELPTDLSAGAGITLEAEGGRLSFWSSWARSSELVLDIDAGLFHGDTWLLAMTRRHSPLIDHLGSIAGCSWLPRAISDDESSPVSASQYSCAGFSVMNDQDELAFEGWIRFDRSAASILNRAQGRFGWRAPVMALVPSCLQICLSSPAVTVEQLRGVVLHAAVVIGSHQQGKIPVRLVSACGGYEVAASLDGDWVTVESSFKRVAGATFANKRGLTMQSAPAMGDDTSTTNQAVDVGDLPVELSFEIGSLSVAFAELESSLKSGYTFNLNRELRHDSVLIRANGAVIANGELLKIGDMLAVRITGIESHGRR
jgi:flagellar motor switch/type III secretory pathway protein FliN